MLRLGLVGALTAGLRGRAPFEGGSGLADFIERYDGFGVVAADGELVVVDICDGAQEPPLATDLASGLDLHLSAQGATEVGDTSQRALESRARHLECVATGYRVDLVEEPTDGPTDAAEAADVDSVLGFDQDPEDSTVVFDVVDGRGLDL